MNAEQGRIPEEVVVRVPKVDALTESKESSTPGVLRSGQETPEVVQIGPFKYDGMEGITITKI